MILGAMALTVTATDAYQGSGVAQGRLDARYTVTLGGLPIGRGAWVIDIADDQFTAAASGATAGLLRVSPAAMARAWPAATVSGGQPASATYTSSISPTRGSTKSAW